MSSARGCWCGPVRAEAGLAKMDSDGKTALEVARETGHPEIAALVKQADEANTVAAEPEPEAGS